MKNKTSLYCFVSYTDSFQMMPGGQAQTSLSSGEIGGLVVGSILLLAAFLLLAFATVAPNRAAAALVRVRGGGLGGRGVATSFENPSSMD